MTPHRLFTLSRSYLGYFLGLLGRVTTLESVRRRDERAMVSDILQRLADLLTRQTTQRASVDQDGLLDISDTFDSLIVIDRRVDMITPLLTQLTYEGLIDEIVHIKNCKVLAIIRKLSLTYAILAHIEVPASLLNAPSNPNQAASGSGSTSAAPAPVLVQDKKRKHHLSASTDPIFSELQDLNFASVGKRLNKAARRLDEDYRV
jgi:hypothetical protein